MYHDLGYLYNTSDDNRINETVKSFFCLSGNASDIVVKRLNEILCSSFPRELLSGFCQCQEFKDLWNLPFNSLDENIISEKFKIHRQPHDICKHHSYESAVLLYRLVRTKKSIFKFIETPLCDDILDNSINSDEENFIRNHSRPKCLSERKSRLKPLKV